MEPIPFQKIRFLILLGAFLFAPSLAFAAVLYVSPSGGSFTVGQTISLQITVSSADQAMNAASGVFSFPKDKLEVTSLSKTGSIISLWVEEPSFSNTAGTVTFEGIVLNPGFTGSAGRIITVNFRVKAGGTAPLRFASGSVLANDGAGTNILTSMSGADFSLGTTVTPPPASSVSDTPSAPVVQSSTHPEEGTWYANNQPAFSWTLPSGVNGVRLLVNESPNSTPTVVYDPPISSRDLSSLNLEDGIWYFHAQLRNSNGWGGITHYKFQIDKEKPQLFETEIDTGDDPTNPTPTLLFKAVDYISGIDYYDVKVGEQEDIIPVKIVGTVVSNPYKLAVQPPGKHTVVIKAVDAAGNETLSALDIIIEPLETPVITEYPQKIQSGEPFVVRGSTYSNSNVEIWLQKEKDDPKSYMVKSGPDGLFAFVADEQLVGGVYALWAVAVDDRGARSEPTEKMTVIMEPSTFLKIGSLTTTVLAVVIPIVALFLFLIGIIWYGLRKFNMWRQGLKKEVKEVERALHKAVEALKEDIAEQVRMLEYTKSRRKLTEEEEKIIERLKKHLDDVEKFVGKEIKDVKKHIRIK